MLIIEATRVGDPGSLGVVIGAAPLVIVLVGSVVARPPTVRSVAGGPHSS